MNRPARTIPFAVTIPIHSGSDPSVIDIDDAREVHGDWPDMRFTDCESPEAEFGHCEYNAAGLEPARCRYCKKLTG